LAAQFDSDLAALLARDFPEDLLRIRHRLWLSAGVMGQR